MADETQTSTEAANGELTRTRRKLRTGVVSSDKMQKTVVVTVGNLVRHPVYGRIQKRNKKFKAHDENNDAHTGDTVEIMETRPLSKDKCWRVIRVIERAK
jgi:small subunit ribosomal protein S17